MAAAAAAATIAAAPTGAGASTGSLGTSPSAPATYAVRCVGLCAEDSVPALHSLLKALCVRRTYHDENEYGMSAPLQSNSKQGSFKMIKQNTPQNQPQMVTMAPQPPVMWRLVHESPPLRGAQYNSLPAAVLEVSEAALAGIYSVQFLVGLGATIRYRVARHNYVYVCAHEGLEVQVSVFTVHDRTDDGQAQPPLFPGAAVEVSVTVGQEQQIEAARKLGGFCRKLLPLVLLKKG